MQWFNRCREQGFSNNNRSWWSGMKKVNEVEIRGIRIATRRAPPPTPQFTRQHIRLNFFRLTEIVWSPSRKGSTHCCNYSRSWTFSPTSFLWISVISANSTLKEFMKMWRMLSRSLTEILKQITGKILRKRINKI